MDAMDIMEKSLPLQETKQDQETGDFPVPSGSDCTEHPGRQQEDPRAIKQPLSPFSMK